MKLADQRRLSRTAVLSGCTTHRRSRVLGIAAAIVSLSGCVPSQGAARSFASTPSTPRVSSSTLVQHSSTTDYRKLEAEIFAELNLARTNPPAYSAVLAELVRAFDGKVLHRPGWPFAVLTREGPDATQEAIDALQHQKQLPPLVLDEDLSRAAFDHAIDQGRSGALGHTGSDNSSPGDRISRHGTWTGSWGENIDYGAVIGGRDVVEDLVVDDGVQSRGHRRNIYDPAARIVGIGCGPHPTFGVVCVIDQANGFTPRAGSRQN